MPERPDGAGGKAAAPSDVHDGHEPASRLSESAILRLRAFPTREGGGNPAGVVLSSAPEELTDAVMQETARWVGYSETAFITDGPAASGRRSYRVRYFSPAAEVPFCGHATIAVGVALAQRTGPGDYLLQTQAGPVAVRTVEHDGEITASLTSVQPAVRAVDEQSLADALRAIGLDQADLDPHIPPAVAYAGAWHLILAVRNRRTLTDLSYDFDALRVLSVQHGWVTVHVAFMEQLERHHVRALFPYGGVREDPATGAGAAAYACYLRSLGVLRGPAQLQILQGEDMGQPCLLRVWIDVTGPAVVTGTAVVMQ